MDDCIERVRHSRLMVTEKGKSVTILNPERDELIRVRVDGCLVTNQDRRADWIITHPGVGSAIIELKGRDVEHGVSQLLATIGRPDCQEFLQRPVHLLVICAKYPSFDTRVARAQVEAKKRGMNLRVICRSFESRMNGI
jgi:hypothetical protein